jgi:hypothetical protein
MRPLQSAPPIRKAAQSALAGIVGVGRERRTSLSDDHDQRSMQTTASGRIEKACIKPTMRPPDFDQLVDIATFARVRRLEICRSAVRWGLPTSHQRPLSARPRNVFSKAWIRSSRSRSHRVRLSSRVSFSAAISSARCFLASSLSASATHSHSSCVPLNRWMDGFCEESETVQPSASAFARKTLILRTDHFGLPMETGNL